MVLFYLFTENLAFKITINKYGRIFKGFKITDISQMMANMWLLSTAIFFTQILLAKFRKGMCMGAKDMTENYLEAYNDVFADLVNVLLFDGKRVVDPNQLRQAVEKAVEAVGLHGHTGRTVPVCHRLSDQCIQYRIFAGRDS